MDERVLVVEDDASIREVVQLGLERAGFRVATTSTTCRPKHGVPPSC